MSECVHAWSPFPELAPRWSAARRVHTSLITVPISWFTISGPLPAVCVHRRALLLWAASAFALGQTHAPSVPTSALRTCSAAIFFGHCKLNELVSFDCVCYADVPPTCGAINGRIAINDFVDRCAGERMASGHYTWTDGSQEKLSGHHKEKVGDGQGDLVVHSSS